MPRKKILYLCPRCGYQTDHKNFMRNHLYTLKKPCAGKVMAIDLTDDIKEHVLANRVWHQPPLADPPPTIHQTINNYNTMNNLVTRIDDLTKLMSYMDHTQTPLVNLSEQVEDMYAKHRTAMETMRSKNIFLENGVIFETIDDVTSAKDLTVLNVLYEEVAQKLRIYDDNEWRTVLFDTGITEIITRIKDYYLDVYERYLLKLWHNPSSSLPKRAYIKEHVEEYYRFIACYSLHPFVRDQSDQEILEDDEHPRNRHDICDKWYSIYKEIKDNLPAVYVTRIKRDVARIVKRNAKANVLELNKKVMELIRMDEDFKNNVLVGVLGDVA